MILDVFSNLLINYASFWSVFMPMFMATAAEGASGDGVTDWGMKYLGAGIAAVSYTGAALGQGIIGANACTAIGRNPEANGQITKAGMVFAGIAESGAIYGLVISILILFVV
ncbi:F0F1 ATP synthase subunit C [Spiroplasma sp. TIUS-1]|uniref:F0F1 ATP synthase subunit C n=1 Tax=Spiroplasma sp. TIUS-1 TaxID=216963 RepID=UPI0013983EAC|nr:F0F1 ATP synthase subunit C [Spiroplasma sp. TIUS-1]QHX35604.1 F0F1 ATP synthase subunit C [Spiroplasma sp. TIUS-1]